MNVFDLNPAKNELDAIGINSLLLSLRHGVDIDDPVTAENYQVSEDDAAFDLALLYEHRGDPETAQQYWDKIPERAAEYHLGYDNESILIK